MKAVCLVFVISIESIIIAAAPRPTVVQILSERICKRCGDEVRTCKMSDGSVTQIPSECKDLAERMGSMLVGDKGPGWAFGAKKDKE